MNAQANGVLGGANGTLKRFRGCPLIPGFAEIRTADGIVFVQISEETYGGHIKGWRVRPDGSRWERETKDATQVNYVIADPEQVVSRCVMNTFYGALEREGTSVPDPVSSSDPSLGEKR